MLPVKPSLYTDALPCVVSFISREVRHLCVRQRWACWLITRPGTDEFETLSTETKPLVVGMHERKIQEDAENG